MHVHGIVDKSRARSTTLRTTWPELVKTTPLIEASGRLVGLNQPQGFLLRIGDRPELIEAGGGQHFAADRGGAVQHQAARVSSQPPPEVNEQFQHVGAEV